MSVLNVRDVMEINPNLCINDIINGRGAPPSEVLYFPAGTYQLTKCLSIPTWVTCIYGDGMDATILAADGKDIPLDAKIIKAQRGKWKPISNTIKANIPRFSSFITFKEPLAISDCQPGDMLMLHNTNKASFGDFSGPPQCSQARDLYQGELLKVAHIESNRTKIWLIGATQGSYNVEQDKVIVSSCRDVKSLTLRDFSFVGTKRNANETGIQISCGRNIVVQRIRSEGSYRTGCEFVNCLDVSVSDIFIDLSSGVAIQKAGDAYGMAISDSQNVRVTTSTLIGLTHAVMVGSSGAETAIVNRQILVDGCHLTTYRAGYGIALDFHPNSELCTFSNNHCFGGISLAGRQNRIIGNDVYAIRDVSERPEVNEPLVCLFADEMVDIEHDIINNRFHGPSYGNQQEQGVIIFRFYTATSAEAGPLRIVDNRIVCINGTDGHAIKFSRETGEQLNFAIIVQGNYIYTDSKGDALFFSGSPRIAKDNVIILNNITRNCHIDGSIQIPSP